MPKRSDIESILILGAGPIVIGQACEQWVSTTSAAARRASTRIPWREGESQFHGLPAVPRTERFEGSTARSNRLRRRLRRAPNPDVPSRYKHACPIPWFAYFRLQACHQNLPVVVAAVTFEEIFVSRFSAQGLMALGAVSGTCRSPAGPVPCWFVRYVCYSPPPPIEPYP